jgi:MFS family permease
MGAGGVMSLAGILISDVVKIEYRGIYQSYFNMSYGLGNGLGASLGGFLCDRYGWRMAFYLQLPFILAYSVLAFIACPADLGPNLAKTEGKTLRQAFSTFDALGAIALAVTVTCLILGVNLGGNIFPWTHPLVIASLVVFGIASVSLYFIERKAALPLLPIPLLSTTPNGNLMWSNFLGAIVTNTVLFNVPLYLQAVRQTTPTVSGLFLVSPLVGVSITAVGTGFYITRTRKMKEPMVVGTFCLLLGAILVTSLSSGIPTWAVPILIPFCSIGQGFFFPSVTIAVLALNSQDEQAVVTTTLGLLRNVGAILGVAVSSWIFQNALIIYLERMVTATSQARKSHIINKVRESIHAIADLDPLHKDQVQRAYAASLRLTFVMTIVISVVVIVIILPLKIPRLQRQSDMDSTDSTDPNEEGGILDARDQVAMLHEDVGDDSESEAGEGSSGGENKRPQNPHRTESNTGMYRTITGGSRASRAASSAGRSISRDSASMVRRRESRVSFDVHF